MTGPGTCSRCRASRRGGVACAPVMADELLVFACRSASVHSLPRSGRQVVPAAEECAGEPLPEGGGESEVAVVVLNGRTPLPAPRS
jgi:hypothetical protein